LNALWLTQVRTTSDSKNDLRGIVGGYLDIYYSLEPCSGPEAELKTLILIFPDIPDRDADALIGSVHRMMKPRIVDEGLMLGEFYADSISPALHNPQFYPLRSPIPLLVYRRMVPNDLVFLTKPSDPPESRMRFVSAYLKFLGERLPAETLAEAQSALRSAAAEARALSARGAGA
jgi:hypothetical protein